MRPNHVLGRSSPPYRVLVPVRPSGGGLHRADHHPVAEAPVVGARLALSVGVLVAVPLLALNLRPAVTSVGAMLADIRSGTGMSAVLASVVVAAPVWCFAVGGGVAWGMRSRFGTARTVSLALAVLAATLAARVLAGPLLLLVGTILACLAIAVLGTLLPVITHAAPARSWALLTGCYIAAMGGGSGLGALVTPQVAGRSSWQLGVSGWALLAAAAWAAWRVASRRFTEPSVRAKKHPGPGSLAPAGTAWSLTLHFGLTSGFTFSIMGWLPSILRDYSHVDPTRVEWMFTVAMALGVPIALLVPRWARGTTGQSGLAVALAAPNLVAIVGLLVLPEWGPWLWSIGLGLGMPAVGLALTMISLRAAADGDTAAALSSMVQGIGYAIAGATALACGLLHSSTSAWEWPLLALLVVLCGQILFGMHAGLPVTVRAGGRPTEPVRLPAPRMSAQLPPAVRRAPPARPAPNGHGAPPAHLPAFHAPAAPRRRYASPRRPQVGAPLMFGPVPPPLRGPHAQPHPPARFAPPVNGFVPGAHPSSGHGRPPVPHGPSTLPPVHGGRVPVEPPVPGPSRIPRPRDPGPQAPRRDAPPVPRARGSALSDSPRTEVLGMESRGTEVLGVRRVPRPPDLESRGTESLAPRPRAGGPAEPPSTDSLVPAPRRGEPMAESSLTESSMTESLVPAPRRGEPVTEPVTDSVTDSVTEPVTEPATDPLVSSPEPGAGESPSTDSLVPAPRGPGEPGGSAESSTDSLVPAPRGSAEPVAVWPVFGADGIEATMADSLVSAGPGAVAEPDTPAAVAEPAVAEQPPADPAPSGDAESGHAEPGAARQPSVEVEPAPRTQAIEHPGAAQATGRTDPAEHVVESIELPESAEPPSSDSYSAAGEPGSNGSPVANSPVWAAAEAAESWTPWTPDMAEPVQLELALVLEPVRGDEPPPSPDLLRERTIHIPHPRNPST